MIISTVLSFDFINTDGSRVKGNGYRSMLFLLSCVLQPLHNSLQKAAKERGGVFYSPVDHYNTISSHCRALQVIIYYTYMDGILAVFAKNGWLLYAQ